MNNNNNEAMNNEATAATERNSAPRSLLYGRNLRKIAQLTLRGMPTTAQNLRERLARGERVDWREYESAIRATRRWPSNDRFNLPLAARAPSPSRLIVSQSLRDTLLSMARLGNAVALKVALALDYRHHHKPSLFANYFTFRERAGMISYCPANREQEINEDGTWARKGRQEITPAKWARKILCDRLNAEFSDAAISEFASAFNAQERANEVRIEVTDDEEVMDRVIQEIHDRGGYSCMAGDPVGHWYSKQGLKMAVAYDGNGAAVARALLWPSVETNTHNKVPMMERIYAAHNHALSLSALEDILKKWAFENGYWHKKNQSNDCDTLICGEMRTTAVFTTVPHRPSVLWSYLPYLDTFYWAVGTTLYSSELACAADNEDGTEAEEFRSTAGHTSATKVVCGSELVDESKLVETVDGDRVLIEDATYCEDDCEYYPDGDDRLVYCDSYEDMRLRENCRSVYIAGRYRIVHEDHISDA